MARSGDMLAPRLGLRPVRIGLTPRPVATGLAPRALAVVDGRFANSDAVYGRVEGDRGAPCFAWSVRSWVSCCSSANEARLCRIGDDGGGASPSSANTSVGENISRVHGGVWQWFAVAVVLWSGVCACAAVARPCVRKAWQRLPARLKAVSLRTRAVHDAASEMAALHNRG